MAEIIKQRYSEDNVQCIPFNSNSYDFYFLIEHVQIVIEGLSETSIGMTAELSIKHNGIKLLGNVKLNLQNQDQRKRLALDLVGKELQLIDWDELMEYAITEAIRLYRQPPELCNISADPENRSVEYLVDPILPFNQPTTIFSSGGKGKSILADYIAVLVAHGVASELFIPRNYNVLYLDWESDAEQHRRYVTAIEKGLELPHKEIYYLRCERPLITYADYLLDIKEQYEIGLTIVDSQMAATSGMGKGRNDADTSSEYYNFLRVMGTTLTIDHVTKNDMISNNPEAPYGSVVKYNRSRSQFELKIDDGYEDNDHKEYALVHRKFNLGRKVKPIGFAIDFVNNGNELVSITFSPCVVADNQNLAKTTLTRKQRLINALIVLGKANIKELADYIEEPYGVRAVGITLSKEKKTFVRISEGVYGLLTNKPT